MHDLTKIILTSGLIPKEQLAQFQRWGFLPPGPIPDMPVLDNPEQLVQRIEQALQNEELVVVRETDLESLNKYLSTMKPAILHVVLPNSIGDINVMYGLTELGEYILPWSADSLEDVMVNGETYLRDENGTRIFFSSARELFYGDVKAFIVCKPSQKEVTNGNEQAPHTPSI